MRWPILSNNNFKYKNIEFLTLSELLIKYGILIVDPIASRYSIFRKLTLSNKLSKIEDNYITLLRTLQQLAYHITLNLKIKLTVITSTLSRHISRSVLQVNPKFQNISSSDKKEIIWQIISNGRSISSNVQVELAILCQNIMFQSNQKWSPKVNKDVSNVCNLSYRMVQNSQRI